MLGGPLKKEIPIDDFRAKFDDLPRCDVDPGTNQDTETSY